MFRKLFRGKQETVSKWAKYFQFIDKKQRAAADYLQKQTSVVRPGILKLWLYLFIALSVGLLCLNVYLGLIKPPPFGVKPMMVPMQPKVNPGNTVDPEKAVMERIKNLYHHIDSLKKSGNSDLYNRLKKSRPGLLDSLEIINKQFFDGK